MQRKPMRRKIAYASKVLGSSHMYGWEVGGGRLAVEFGRVHLDAKAQLC